MTQGAATGELERLARNESTFRDANERVGTTARRLGMDRPIPFICECGRRNCTTIVRVLPADYERVRAHPTHFLYANGHAAGMPESHVIETLEGAVIVEKNGVPARVARETDPRGASRNGQ